jgi:hypothetical protein
MEDIGGRLRLLETLISFDEKVFQCSVQFRGHVLEEFERGDIATHILPFLNRIGEAYINFDAKNLVRDQVFPVFNKLN